MPLVTDIESAIDPSMQTSNLYNLPENILLKWLTLHRGKLYSFESTRMINFDADFKDGTLLNALITSH